MVQFQGDVCPRPKTQNGARAAKTPVFRRESQNSQAPSLHQHLRADRFEALKFKSSNGNTSQTNQLLKQDPALADLALEMIARNPQATFGEISRKVRHQVSPRALREVIQERLANRAVYIDEYKAQERWEREMEETGGIPPGLFEDEPRKLTPQERFIQKKKNRRPSGLVEGFSREDLRREQAEKALARLDLSKGNEPGSGLKH